MKALGRRLQTGSGVARGLSQGGKA